jgi:hypothetical protein
VLFVGQHFGTRQFNLRVEVIKGIVFDHFDPEDETDNVQKHRPTNTAHLVISQKSELIKSDNGESLKARSCHLFKIFTELNGEHTSLYVYSISANPSYQICTCMEVHNMAHTYLHAFTVRSW